MSHGSLKPLTRLRSLSPRASSHWCLNNVAVYGWEGIFCQWGTLVDACADIQCIVEGGDMATGKRKNSMLTFYLTSLRIWIFASFIVRGVMEVCAGVFAKTFWRLLALEVLTKCLCQSCQPPGKAAYRRDGIWEKRKGRRASASGDWFKTDIPERDTITQNRKWKRRDSETWEGNRRNSIYRKKPRGLTTKL